MLQYILCIYQLALELHFFHFITPTTNRGHLQIRNTILTTEKVRYYLAFSILKSHIKFIIAIL